MIEKICKKCGKKFKVYPYRKDKAKFCSYKCYWKYLSTIPGPNKGKKFSKSWRENLSKSDKGKHRSPKTEFKKGHKMSKKVRKKISNTHKHIGTQPPVRCGSANNRWKPPEKRLTPITKQVRKSRKFKQWREAVFKRDNYICQGCQQKSNWIHPHHIKSFSQIWKENSIKTFQQAMSCKELWNIDNGITLCADCHRKKHTYTF